MACVLQKGNVMPFHHLQEEARIAGPLETQLSLDSSLQEGKRQGFQLIDHRKQDDNTIAVTLFTWALSAKRLIL